MRLSTLEFAPTVGATRLEIDTSLVPPLAGSPILRSALSLAAMSTLPRVASSVRRVVGLERSVCNLSRSIDFYCGGLGFSVVAEGGATPRARACLALGGDCLDLVEVGAARAQAVAAPDPRFQHLAVVAARMGDAMQRLSAFEPLPISRAGPQRLPANAGGVTAYKFRDPDAHPIELIHFPAGVGASRWHRATPRATTLGIDHFAMAVADVGRSIAFYGALGFRVAKRQTNRGAAQNRLDGLTESVVEVVALELSATGPHLELLGYQRPPPDRAPTQSMGRSDVIFLTSDRHMSCPSTGRDPDGHALRFV